jgi:hypothetical protein
VTGWTSTPRRRSGAGAGAGLGPAGIVVALFAGAGIAGTSPSYHVVLPLLYAAVSIGAVAWCLRVRPLRWLDPLIWMVIPLAIQLVTRPLADLAAGSTTYRHYWILPEMTKTSTLVLVGLLALLAGYAVGVGPWIARSIRPLPTELDSDRVFSLTGRLGALALFGYAVYTVQSGLSLGALANAGLPSAGGTSSAYFGLSPLFAVPICLLLLHQGLNRHSSSLTAGSVVIAVPIVLIEASVGNRFYALFLVGSLSLYLIIRFRWRPPKWVIAAILAVGLLFVSATSTLHAGTGNPSLVSNLTSSFVHPGRALRHLVLGPTLEEFDGLAVEVHLVPKTLNYHPLTSLTSVLAQPIPRSLWGGKPHYPDGEFDAAAFAVQPGSASVAETIVGGFYYDSGFLGAFIGLLLIGVLLRLLSDYLSLPGMSDFNHLTLAAVLPLVVMLSRGNLGNALSDALFVVFPLPVIAVLARRHSPRRTGRTMYASSPRSS